MEITFEDRELELVYFMLVDPAALVPPGPGGAPRIGAGAQPYRLSEPDCIVEVAALKKLFLAKVFRRETAEDPRTGEPLVGYRWTKTTLRIRQIYVDRLKSMAKHYKDAFAVLPWAEAWAALNARLLGETFTVPDAEEAESPGTDPGKPAQPAGPVAPGQDETAAIAGAVGA